MKSRNKSRKPKALLVERAGADREFPRYRVLEVSREAEDEWNVKIEAVVDRIDDGRSATAAVIWDASDRSAELEEASRRPCTSRNRVYNQERRDRHDLGETERGRASLPLEGF